MRPLLPPVTAGLAAVPIGYSSSAVINFVVTAFGTSASLAFNSGHRPA